MQTDFSAVLRRGTLFAALSVLQTPALAQGDPVEGVRMAAAQAMVLLNPPIPPLVPSPPAEP